MIIRLVFVLKLKRFCKYKKKKQPISEVTAPTSPIPAVIVAENPVMRFWRKVWYVLMAFTPSEKQK